jgi:metal-sulfur cluster biosynthetic enzyme
MGDGVGDGVVGIPLHPPTRYLSGRSEETPFVQEEDDVEAAQSGELNADQVRLALRRVKDPEIGLNIVDLGLIYEVTVDGADVNVDMSLTSPGCPAGPQILHEAEEELRSLPGVGGVNVNLIWSPPWTPERIEPRVRAYLGF